MEVETVLAGVAVADFESSIAWYESLLGRPADVRPMDGLAQWHMSDSALFQVLQEPDRAGGSVVGFTVADLPKEIEAIRGRGLAPEADDRQSDKVLFETFIDPEGNKVGVLAPRGSSA